MAVRWNKTAFVEVVREKTAHSSAPEYAPRRAVDMLRAKSREAPEQHGTLFPFHAVSSTQHLVGDVP